MRLACFATKGEVLVKEPGDDEILQRTPSTSSPSSYLRLPPAPPPDMNQSNTQRRPM